MSTKDNNPGLLSKVAKFVRNPTTNWTDLDKQDPEPDNGYSKQALKEMIERKRQNDFVRKREFDQLRKLRSRDPSGGNPDLAGRPSYFQSSLPSNSDDRKMTIKKIDEIEAQMSNQWWQGKNAGVKAPTGAAPANSTPDHSRNDSQTTLPPSQDMVYQATKLSPMVSDATIADHSDFMPTQTSSSFDKHALAMSPPSAQKPANGKGVAVIGSGFTAKAHDSSGFAYSQSFAMELVDGVTDPDLEEAAIRFANGDNAGAEEGLLEALRGDEVSRELAETWTAALFDLYRATGQQARFDAVALDYAERFGRSAPAWLSMPDLLGIKSGDGTARTMPSPLVDDPIWSSPRVFGRASVDELQLAIANAASPWFLDWSLIEAIAPDAVDAMGGLFSEWATTLVQLRFRGAEALEDALRSSTPSGNKTMSTVPWRLRMDALRLMQLQDEFELVALDFCVTYEVSPPAWQDARCHFYRDTATTGDAQLVGNADRDEADLPRPEPEDFQSLTVPMGLESVPATVVELSGEILGEATDALSRLENARQGGERLVISCANLIRVDFSAAGSILNWVALRQAEGCHLQFREVHRLVAAFFIVIGIHEHARVVLRSN
jgi:anti-anti-sigma regulatory factor